VSKIENKALTVGELVEILQNSVMKKTIKVTDTIRLASDEEGNSYSNLVFEGIAKDEENHTVCFYPLFPEET